MTVLVPAFFALVFLFAVASIACSVRKGWQAWGMISDELENLDGQS